MTEKPPTLEERVESAGGYIIAALITTRARREEAEQLANRDSSGHLFELETHLMQIARMLGIGEQVEENSKLQVEQVRSAIRRNVRPTRTLETPDIETPNS